MKLIFTATMILLSMNAFSYDNGLLTRNCVAANISVNDTVASTAIIKEIEKLKISNARIVVKTDNQVSRVIISGRNTRLRFNKEDGLYFDLNKDLRRLLADEQLKENGVDFEFTTVGECLESF
jgi:hypothetical protein